MDGLLPLRLSVLFFLVFGGEKLKRNKQIRSFIPGDMFYLREGTQMVLIILEHTNSLLKKRPGAIDE